MTYSNRKKAHIVKDLLTTAGFSSITGYESILKAGFAIAGDFKIVEGFDRDQALVQVKSLLGLEVEEVRFDDSHLAEYRENGCVAMSENDPNYDFDAKVDFLEQEWDDAMTVVATGEFIDARLDEYWCLNDLQRSAIDKYIEFSNEINKRMNNGSVMKAPRKPKSLRAKETQEKEMKDKVMLENLMQIVKGLGLEDPETYGSGPSLVKNRIIKYAIGFGYPVRVIRKALTEETGANVTYSRVNSVVRKYVKQLEELSDMLAPHGYGLVINVGGDGVVVSPITDVKAYADKHGLDYTPDEGSAHDMEEALAKFGITLDDDKLVFYSKSANKAGK